jgi:hypothetical protein
MNPRITAIVPMMIHASLWRLWGGGDPVFKVAAPADLVSGAAAAGE